MRDYGGYIRVELSNVAQVYSLQQDEYPQLPPEYFGNVGNFLGVVGGLFGLRLFTFECIRVYSARSV